MIRKLKLIGCTLTLFAVLAATASIASAALFRSTVSTTILSGVQTSDQVFTTPAGKTTCKKLSLSGEQLGTTTSAEATLTPSYDDCKMKTMFGEISVTVNFNGCDYLFTASGDVHIKCPAGQGPVIISGPGCTITMGVQTIKSFQYASGSSGGKKDVTFTSLATGITSSASGVLCSDTGKSTNATYHGTATVTGTNGSTAVDYWYE